MKQVPPGPSRCAVYTRKSTEHNLDLAFNSLDAQREACEAYVKSQAHEGWRLLPGRYDDGGLSGASLDRPALQQLLTDIRAGNVDIIVVYKVDRLTRSLADFAKLVETFDIHGVAFVSVTQSFNTTSSMGRLTLNVLLSFAQFEREVIGERVRDKIAASKRKGLWVGGPVPLGYRSVDKALAVMPDEATIVRTMFEQYVAVGSIGLLIDDLARRGITPRRNVARRADSSKAPSVPSVDRFTLGPLAYILKNRIYVGEVAYKGEIYAGQHEPIIGRALFDAVQAKLADAAVTRRSRHNGSSHLLIGRLYDDCGHHMSPSHANKAGVRYRYYVSQALLQNRKADAGTISRVAAPDIEALVITAARRQLFLSEPQVNEDGSAGAEFDLSDRDLLARHVERVVLHPDHVEIVLGDTVPDRLDTTAHSDLWPKSDAGMPPDSHNSYFQKTICTVPWIPKRGWLPKGITSEPRGDKRIDPKSRNAILVAIGKARGWINDFMAGRVSSFEEIANCQGQSERHIRLLTPLAFVAPTVIAAIVDGTAPAGSTVSGLARSLPHFWAEQEKLLGIA